MTATPPSLMIRLRDLRDAEAWDRFHRIYSPLLFRYARARGLNEEDAAEVRDQCLSVVSSRIEQFEYDRSRGSFKRWLARIADNKVVDLFRQRARRQAHEQDAPVLKTSAASPAELWEQHWKREHLRFCIEEARSGASKQEADVFDLLVLQEMPVQVVCDRLGISANMVYKAKSNMLQRIRKTLSELGTTEDVP